MAETTNSKLPVFRTVGRAYSALIENFGPALQVVWFWAIALAVVHWLWQALAPAWTQKPEQILSLSTDRALLLCLINFVFSLITLPAYASIAVNWHRFLLLGERPSASVFMRLDAPVWAYVGLAAVMAFLQALSTLPQQLVIPHVHDHSISPIWSLLGFVPIVVLFFLGRLAVGLPGRAIGDPSAATNGYAASRGNTWRLAWGAIWCFLPVILVGLFLLYVWPGQQALLARTPQGVTASIVAGGFFPLFGLVYVGFLSYAFEHFLPGHVAEARAHAPGRA